MKRFLSIISVFLMCCGLYAQSPLDSITIQFRIVNASGAMESPSSNPEFIVLEYKGKTASELYSNVLSAISSVYNNPEKVVSKVDNTSIKVSGTEKDVVVDDNGIYAFDYDFLFQFKDGKIRVNAPYLKADRVLYCHPWITDGRYKPVSSSFPYMHFNKPNDPWTLKFQSCINEIIEVILRKSETVNDW